MGIADWRMIMGIQPAQPDFLGGITQGIGIGNALRQNYYDEQMRSGLANAVNQETGDMDDKRVVSALLAGGRAEDAIRYMQQNRIMEFERRSADLTERLLAESGAVGGGGMGLGGNPQLNQNERLQLVAGSMMGHEGIGKVLADIYANKQKVLDTMNAENRGLITIPATPAYPQTIVPRGQTPYAVTIPGAQQPQPLTQQSAPPLQQPTPPLQQQVPTQQSAPTQQQGQPPTARQQSPGDILDTELITTTDQGGKVSLTAKEVLAVIGDNRRMQALASQIGQKALLDLVIQFRGLQTPASSQPATGMYGGIPAGESLNQKQIREQEIEIAKERRAEETAKRAEERAADKENEKRLYESWAKPIIETSKAVEDQRASVLAQKEVLKKINTGPGEPTLDKLKRIWVATKLAPESVINSVSNVEKLNTLMLISAGDFLRENAGQQTEGDAERAQNIYATLEKTKEANEFVLDYHLAVIEQKQERINFIIQGIRERKSQAQIQQEWANSEMSKKSVFDYDVMKDWRKGMTNEEWQYYQQQRSGSSK